MFALLNPDLAEFLKRRDNGLTERVGEYQSSRTNPMTITIRETTSGTTLAEAEVGPSLAKYEGNWYFDRAAVQAGVLKITERTYTCPMKGTCNWVDYVGEDGRIVKDVAWVYPDVKPGHELIRGRYGFYSGSRGATRAEE
jgi:uncharacterized protein (DUF427 family)